MYFHGNLFLYSQPDENTCGGFPHKGHRECQKGISSSIQQIKVLFIRGVYLKKYTYLYRNSSLVTFCLHRKLPPRRAFSLHRNVTILFIPVYQIGRKPLQDFLPTKKRPRTAMVRGLTISRWDVIAGSALRPVHPQ